MSTITHHGNTFEVVTQWPRGYEVWNIGENMVEGYLPLCRPAPNQGGGEWRFIDKERLKAIRIDSTEELKALRKAAHRGCFTKERAQAFIEAHADAEPGTYLHVDVQAVKLAISVMERLEGGVV